MLTELRIGNFAIIDDLELHFAPGLATFTGETGTGKTIIIEALETLLGSRADNTYIRTGANRAIIEATFRLTSPVRTPIHELLQGEDLLDDPDFVILARELRSGSRNIARVNGRSVRVGLLREIGEHLVDIHGQSEHLSLLHVRHHLGLLDRYAIVDAPLGKYQETYKRLQSVRSELDTLRHTEREAARRVDLLTYQINEIKAATLQTGEEKTLREERSRLANAETLASLSQEAIQFVDEGTPESPAISDLLGQVVENIENLARTDQTQSALSQRIKGLFEDLTDIGLSLRAYLEGIEFNPKRLEQVEERLGLIHNLKRKYGDTIGDVLKFAGQAGEELDTITNAGERILELEKEERELLVQLGNQGSILADRRKQAAEKLNKAIENELTDLRMTGARFHVDFQRRPDPDGVFLPDGERVAFSANGLERVEFLIETNPGEGFKPLVKIASGGETARIMLAMKNVLARADTVPTLIFDEIDQGIGGRVGAVVGQKLWSLSAEHQVVCITHLPQLAAFGHSHFRVDKHVLEGRTTSNVELIEGEDRLHELANMLGEVSVGTLKSAQEILQNVEKVTKFSKK
jgi:DNA repair protein RecN (Recombination protein N)